MRSCQVNSAQLPHKWRRSPLVIHWEKFNIGCFQAPFQHQNVCTMWICTNCYLLVIWSGYFACPSPNSLAFLGSHLLSLFSKPLPADSLPQTRLLTKFFFARPCCWDFKNYNRRYKYRENSLWIYKSLLEISSASSKRILLEQGARTEQQCWPFVSLKTILSTIASEFPKARSIASTI